MSEKIVKKKKQYLFDSDEPRSYERKTKTPEQALASLMRLCARSEKSSGDALRLMRGWGVEATDQQEVLSRLIEQKFIDDNRYAEAYVREKTRLGGWGSYKIRRMLNAKGVSQDIINRVLSQLDGDAVRNRLAEMLAKKMRLTKTDNAYELKGKLIRYGMSLGYDYEDVASQVEKLINKTE